MRPSATCLTWWAWLCVGAASTAALAEDAPARPAGPEVAPQVAPKAAEGATGQPTAEPERAGPALGEVRAELSRVMDELMAVRARTSIVAKALFHTPLSMRVVRRADGQRIEHLTLLLDGVPVHDSNGAAVARQGADLFTGFVAPGLHEVGIKVVEASAQQPDYRYTREERFRFVVKKGMRTQVEFVLRDRSDMAEELPSDDDGEYDVGTVVRIRAEPVKAR